MYIIKHAKFKRNKGEKVALKISFVLLNGINIFILKVLLILLLKTVLLIMLSEICKI